MMGDSVGRERMSTAMALDVVAQNASRMVGPTLGGVVLVAGGIEGAFLLSAGLYLLAVGATLSVRGHRAPAPHAEPVLARVREGIAAVLANRRLAAILAVTIVFNIFGWPFTSMIPVIGRDQLALGPEGVGLLTSIDGVGAFVGALVLALAPGAALARASLCRRRGALPARHHRLRAGARRRARFRRPAADRTGRRRLRHPAGDPGLSRGAPRDALAHHGRAVGLHRHRPARLPVAGLARRPHRRARGDRHHRRARASPLLLALRPLWRTIYGRQQFAPHHDRSFIRTSFPSGA